MVFVNMARETGPCQFSKTIVHIIKTGRWCHIYTVLIDFKRFLAGNRPAGAAARVSPTDLASADLIPGDWPPKVAALWFVLFFVFAFPMVFIFTTPGYHSHT